MTTKEQFQVFDNYTDEANGTWKIGSLTGLFFKDLVEILGKPTLVGSDDEKVQCEWIVKFEDQVFTIYDWKTYDAEYTKNELDTWSIGGNDSSATMLDEFKHFIYGNL